MLQLRELNMSYLFIESLTKQGFNDKILKEIGRCKMARNISTKKPLTANSRSKAKNATKRRQKPNLQKRNINGESVLISTREAKKLN